MEVNVYLTLRGGHAQNLDTISSRWHHTLSECLEKKSFFYLKVCFYACFLCAVVMPERHRDRPKIFFETRVECPSLSKSPSSLGKSLTSPISLSQATDQTWSYQSAERRKQIAILRIQSERRRDVCSIFSLSFYWIWNCKQDTWNQSSCKITRISFCTVLLINKISVGEPPPVSSKKKDYKNKIKTMACVYFVSRDCFSGSFRL
jgi:hypothetical protein